MNDDFDQMTGWARYGRVKRLQFELARTETAEKKAEIQNELDDLMAKIRATQESA